MSRLKHINSSLSLSQYLAICRLHQRAKGTDHIESSVYVLDKKTPCLNFSFLSLILGLLPASSHLQSRVEEKSKARAAAEEEAELRRVVQALFEQEENLLNFHMSSKIQVSTHHVSIPRICSFVAHFSRR